MQVSVLKQFPLLKVVIPLISGIWLGSRISNHDISEVLFFVFFTAWLISTFYFFRHPSFRFRFFPGIFFVSFIFVFGIVWYHLRATLVVNSSLPVSIKGYISSYEGETLKSYKFKVTAETLRTDSFLSSQKLTGILYLQKDTMPLSLKPGQTIFISGKLLPFNRPTNPYAFDYSRYLERERVSFRIWSSPGMVSATDTKPVITLNILIGQIHDHISSFFENNGIHGEELALLKALFLGDRSDLRPEDKKSFSNAGVIHLLAVSGLHLGIIYMMLLLLLRPLNNGNYNKIKALTVVTVLWSYALLTGLSPSVFRSAIMFSMVEAGTLLKRHSSVYNQLLASILVIILVDPYSIYKAGFWLSHVAVASIVFFYPLINNLFNFSFIVFRWIWSLISVSLAAQIGTFALSIHYFHMFPAYFILGNILLIPLMAPVLALAFISSVFSFLSATSVISLLIEPLKEMLTYIIDVTRLMEHFPDAVIRYITISDLEIFFFGMMVISLILFNREQRKQAIFLFLTTLILLTASFSYHKINNRKYEAYAVFSNYKAGIFNYLDPDKNILYLTDTLSDIQINYTCGGYWANHHAKDPALQILRKNKPSAHLFTLNDKKLLLLNNIERIPAFTHKPVIDFVILSGSGLPPVNSINDNIRFKKLILSTAIKPWVASKFKKDANEQKIPYYDVNECGAWILQY